jgi:hypothetical protein
MTPYYSVDGVRVPRAHAIRKIMLSRQVDKSEASDLLDRYDSVHLGEPDRFGKLSSEIIRVEWHPDRQDRKLDRTGK